MMERVGARKSDKKLQKNVADPRTHGKELFLTIFVHFWLLRGCRMAFRGVPGKTLKTSFFSKNELYRRKCFFVDFEKSCFYCSKTTIFALGTRRRAPKSHQRAQSAHFGHSLFCDGFRDGASFGLLFFDVFRHAKKPPKSRKINPKIRPGAENQPLGKSCRHCSNNTISTKNSQKNMQKSCKNRYKKSNQKNIHFSSIFDDF